MHSDHAIDDELQARKTDTTMRNAGEIERAIGVADIHHDLRRNLGQRVELDVLFFEWQQAFVDEARVAFRATDRDLRAIANGVRCIATAYDRRNAQLASDDGCVTRAAAAICDDGRSSLHHRLPIGIGHVRDEHIACMHTRHLLHVPNDACASGTDALPDCTSLSEHLGSALQCEPLNRLATTALDGLGPRLQDIELAGLAVLAPFDIHRAAVVLFDDERLFCKLHDVFVRERKARAFLGRHVHCARTHLASGIAIDELRRLRAHRAANDRRMPRAKRLLVHVEFIGVDRALDDGFAETIRGRDEYDIAEARVGVEREHHTARTEVRTNHVLNARRQRDTIVPEALMHAIRNCAIVEQRCEHLSYTFEHSRATSNVQERLLLTGERGLRQVLRGRRGAHSDGDIAPFTHPIEGIEDFPFEPLRKRSRHDPTANPCADGRQRFHIVNIESGELSRDAL